MSDFDLPLSASPTAQTELTKLVESIRDALEGAGLPGVNVRRDKAEVDEDSFSQAISITAGKPGSMKLEVAWEKSEGKASISLETRTKASGILTYVPIVCALLFAFIADKNRELLPVFRGIRVALGAGVGIAIGAVLSKVLTGVLTKPEDKFPAETEAKVRAIVGDLLQARGAREAA
jgi:hypothetical protein